MIVADFWEGSTSVVMKKIQLLRAPAVLFSLGHINCIEKNCGIQWKNH